MVAHLVEVKCLAPEHAETLGVKIPAEEPGGTATSRYVVEYHQL
jgi:hypothetical protein